MSSLPIIEIGKVNHLKVLKDTPQGYYVGDEVEEILLPGKYIPEGLAVGEYIDVFIYTDSEDRMVATTLIPKIQRDEFGFLLVKETTSVGAFMEWGLDKDLLVPFKEQRQRMEAGVSYLVYMYLDEVTDRLVASSHLNKFLKRNTDELEEGQEVSLLIGPLTELGYQAIINGSHRGLLFKNEVFKDINPGDRTTGFIKQIREDGKIDVTLEKQGYESIEPNADRLYEKLVASDGYLALYDKSDPEKIREMVQMSKKNFKKAVGALYKKRMIELEGEGIRLKNLPERD